MSLCALDPSPNTLKSAAVAREISQTSIVLSSSSTEYSAWTDFEEDGRWKVVWFHPYQLSHRHQASKIEPNAQAPHSPTMCANTSENTDHKTSGTPAGTSIGTGTGSGTRSTSISQQGSSSAKLAPSTSRGEGGRSGRFESCHAIRTSGKVDTRQHNSTSIDIANPSGANLSEKAVSVVSASMGKSSMSAKSQSRANATQMQSTSPIILHDISLSAGFKVLLLVQDTNGLGLSFDESTVCTVR